MERKTIMKVKIGYRMFDSHEEPIMIVMSEDDKKNIKKMPIDKFTYCTYPDRIPDDEILTWMKNYEK
jgi:hypothetical protein